MILKKLGNTDIELSAIGLGTWAIGGAYEYGWGEQDDRESIAAIRAAVEMGINWVDTAPVYGLGHSEELVGEALENFNNIIISTKCGYVWDDRGTCTGSLKKDSIRSEVELSLKRLKRDVIDLYQVHYPFPGEDLEEGWRVLADLVKEGKIRYAGVSNFSREQLELIQPVHPVAFLQVQYNMLDLTIEKDILEYCSDNNIGVMAFSPMSRGLLTGKFSLDRIGKLPPDDHRLKLDDFREPYLSANLQLVEKMRTIARRNSKTLPQLAIAWTLRRPEITTAIVGARRPFQIEQTAPAGDWVLSKEDVAELDAIVNEHHALLKKLKDKKAKSGDASITKFKSSYFADSTSPEFDQEYKVDIYGSAGKDGLDLGFHYNRFEYDGKNMETFADLFKKNLRKVIDHCVEKKKEITAQGMNALDYHIKKDYEKYLERAKAEEWADLGVINDYRNILLTGATGFLGGHMVPELLSITKATLYLPVRGANQEQVEKRFMQKMLFYFGEEFYEKNKDRLIPIRADLAEEHMAIVEPRYEELCEVVDAIVHPAANVKHHTEYEELYRDNVIATERLLELAVTGKKKDFHFISTLSVAEGDIPGRDTFVYTEYCHDVGQQIPSIYVKSKFEAEKKVLAYREKGLNASLHRVGNLIFHTESGRFQENIEDDYFYAIIKGTVKLELVAEFMRKIAFDMSFIDYSARATVLLLTRANLKNETYHLLNPNVLTMMEMAELLRELGYKINEMTDAEAEEYFGQFEGNGEYEKIIELLKLHSTLWDERGGTKVAYKIDRTVMLLEKLGFKWPQTDKHLVEKMLAYCKDVGFI